MLKQRVATAVVLAGIFLALLFFLPVPLFSAFVGTIVLISAWEWSNLSGLTRLGARIAYLVGQTVLMLLLASYLQLLPSLSLDQLLPIASSVPERYQQLLMVGAVWWALALLWVQGYPSSAILWARRPVRAVIGLLVLLPTWVAFTYVRAQPGGAWLVLMIVALVAWADIGGYFVGRRLGRHKLAPKVSPGKTWEGFAGGVAANLLFCIVLWWFTRSPLIALLALVIPASLVSVLGDLLESMVKRERGIKDSSSLLPGHGGVMDRVDGLTAAAPVFALALSSAPVSFG